MKELGVNKSATEGRQDVFDWRLVAGNKIISRNHRKPKSSVSALRAAQPLVCNNRNQQNNNF